jgi:hypothetical protein
MFCFMAGVTDNTTSSYSKDYTPSVEKKREHQALLAEQLKLPYSMEQLATISEYSMQLLSEITGMPL